MRIVVLSRKGGVGKSTTAIHLGGYLAGISEGGDDVLLVDTDPSRNTLRWAKRGRLPFRVVGEDEVDADPAMARDARTLIVDMRGSPTRFCRRGGICGGWGARTATGCC